MSDSQTIHIKLTPKRETEWKPVFLKVLANTANVRAACVAAGISRPVAYKHKNEDPEFGAAWETALEDAVDGLEYIATQRAITTSDTLMIFLLKAHRPEKYRESNRNINLTLTPEELANLSDSELDELERKLTAATSTPRT